MQDLENLSLDELKKLSRDVEKAIATYEERKRKDALKAIEKVAREHGFTIDEVVKTQKAARSKSTREAKFRNPANPSETWSGRGRQPGWYKDAVAAGTSPDKMRA